MRERNRDETRPPLNQRLGSPEPAATVTTTGRAVIRIVGVPGHAVRAHNARDGRKQSSLNEHRTKSEQVSENNSCNRAGARPATPLLLVVKGFEDGGEVLGVGEKAHDIEVVCTHEIEPPALESFD